MTGMEINRTVPFILYSSSDRKGEDRGNRQEGRELILRVFGAAGRAQIQAGVRETDTLQGRQRQGDHLR